MRRGSGEGSGRRRGCRDRGSCHRQLVATSCQLWLYILLYVVWDVEEEEIDRGMKDALTMCVLVLIVASVTGIVLLALFLVMAAAAASAEHLVEEAKLGIGEGEERQEGY